MKIVPALLSSVIVCGLLAIRMATAADGPPAWAYTPNNPDYKPPVDDGKPVRVPDSTAGYTWSQLRDRFIAPVWHPSDHGALPKLTKLFRKRKLGAKARIDITVTVPGADGHVVRFTTRKGAIPKRTDLCLPAGASKPGPC